MRAVMAFILTSQYRFIPLDGRAIRHPRIPKDSLTPLALQLLQLRAAIHPELLPQYTLWTQASYQSHEPSSEEPTSLSDRHDRPKRRRNRR